MTRAAVIGKDGRTSAIIEALSRSKRTQGSIELLSGWKFSPFQSSREEEVRLSLKRLEKAKQKPDFVFCGPEEPLSAGQGIVNWLWDEFKIPCIGPTKKLARIEASKSFTRQLLEKYMIPGNPKFRVFKNANGIKSYMAELKEFVVKPDGLTGGKGVKVFGEHLNSIEQAVAYCNEIFLEGHASVIIEEKLEGEEFSLQAFCDGVNVVNMPVVQDHKRARPGDSGPNTGGMGSYSCADHSMPFLRRDELEQASAINKLVVEALKKETGESYKGVLYGGFMVTREGVRLIEYNSRFGDPEALNVLSLLKTDFVDVCEAMIKGTLAKVNVEFERLSTVCKYVVPEGYPEKPVKDMVISWNRNQSKNLRTYLAAVDKGDDGVYRLTGSRAIAFVGIAENLFDAETIAENAARSVRGPVYHRGDIGTRELVEKRVAHIKALRENDSNAYEHAGVQLGGGFNLAA